MIRMWISIIGGLGIFFYYFWISFNTPAFELPNHDGGNCVECGK